MLRGRWSQAKEGWVQVEGRGQSCQARVVDHAEASQRLDLLPAVELLPQRRRHLRQGLSEEETVCLPEAQGGMDAAFTPAGGGPFFRWQR